jgi:hypothetical protein
MSEPRQSLQPMLHWIADMEAAVRESAERRQKLRDAAVAEDAHKLEALQRIADATERIAKALERAHPERD